MATVVGFAFLWLSVTPVGKQVFLLVVPAIPNAMLCMTTTAATVQKAAFGRKKSPPLAVKKQLIASPLSMPNGQEFILAVFKEIVVRTFPLKKVGNGLSLASLQVSRLQPNATLGRESATPLPFVAHSAAALTFGSALLPHEGCLT